MFLLKINDKELRTPSKHFIKCAKNKIPDVFPMLPVLFCIHLSSFSHIKHQNYVIPFYKFTHIFYILPKQASEVFQLNLIHAINSHLLMFLNFQLHLGNIKTETFLYKDAVPFNQNLYSAFLLQHRLLNLGHC